jgi:ornithine cyclodeaminase/alanine dehydrogenase-like protein (mu-crystallin family)
MTARVLNEAELREVVGIIGAGVQARYQLECLA